MFKFAGFQKPLVVVVRVLLITSLLAGVFIFPTKYATAAPSISVIPLSWNVVGLDSNNVNVGPENFPVGARVCNTGSYATDVTATFVWDDNGDLYNQPGSYINLRQDTYSAITLDVGAGTVASPTCVDYYFEVAVTRNSAAYDTTRRFHIEVTSSASPSEFSKIETPQPREIYVERLISQNRNSTDLVSYGTSLGSLTSVPAGGTMALVLGQSYYIKLDASTATQGYNQIEDFINFPNTIFQILSVETTYSANSSGYVASPSDKLYGDACLWDMNPDSPSYLSCIGSDGKAGGTIHTTYYIKIIGGAGSSDKVNTLIYDFSGSSFHYNSDFSTSGWTVSISTPMTLSKSFNPVSITTAQSTILSINIGNSGGSAVTGVSLEDTLPAGLTFNEGSASHNCTAGSITFNGSTLSFTNGTVQNGGCTLSVSVTAADNQTYINTTGHLFVNEADTGLTASATLTVADQTTGTGFCSATPQTLASWSVPSTATNPPDLAGGIATTKHSAVSTASTVANIPAQTSIRSSSGHIDSYSWDSYGYKNNGQYIQFTLNTTNFRNISMSFWMANPGSGNGPKNVILSYSTGGTFTDVLTVTNPATGFTQTTHSFSGVTNISGNTVFRLRATEANADNTNSNLLYDDISFSGTQVSACTAVTNKPTLGKTFLQTPIQVGGTSTLRFTLGNTNGTQFTSATFSDTLPLGVTVDSYSSSQCSGTVNVTQSGGIDTIDFSGGVIPANGTCTIDLSVTSSEAGTYPNTTGFISTAESGTNSGSDGYGHATLTVLDPALVTKSFSPNPIYSGQTSGLTITVSNPNLSTSLSGIQFTDTFPSTNLVVVPPASTTCAGGSVNTTANSISLSGATLAAGTSCTVSVDVTSTVVKTDPGYVNSVTVTSTNGGTSEPATDTLVVQTIHPAIGIYKEVSSSVSGPWAKTVGVAPSPTGKVYYRLTIENIGDVPLSPVSVTDVTDPVNALVDDAVTGCSWPSVLPVASATQDPTASCIIGPFDAVTGSNDNTATAHGTYNGTVVHSAVSEANYNTTALLLEKAVTEPNFSDAGDPLHYVFTLTNNGASPLTGPIVVTDSNTTVSCPTMLVVDPDNNAGTDGILGPGESVICRSSYNVTAFDVSVGSVTNSAVATVDSVRSNYSVAKVFSTQPDLIVSKSNNVGGYAQKDTAFIWTIRVANQGASDAIFNTGSTVISDQLPAGAEYDSLAVSDHNGLDNPANLSCNIDGSNLLTCSATGIGLTIGAGGGYFSLTFNVTPSTIGGLSNPSARVDPITLNVDESNEGNNTAGDALNVTANADLEVSKSDSVTSVAAGSTVTYTIEVINHGPANANNAIFSDPAVSNLTITNVTCGSASGEATCPSEEDISVAYMQGLGVAIPSLPSGGKVVFTVTGTAGASGTIVNIAYINVPAGISDPTPGNNSASDSDTISPTANLSITKTDSVASVNAGGTITYTIVVTNSGPTAADGAIFTDLVADNLSVSGVTCGSETGGAACPALVDTTVTLMQDSGIVIPTLPNGGSVTFTVSGTAGASGTIENTASITTPEGVADPVPGNNSASDSTSIIEAVPGLTLVKSATETSYANIDDVLHYSFNVTNSGGTVLAGPVVVSDDKSTDETCPNVNTVGNLDANLDPGESITCSATYTVIGDDITAKSITNLASATADGVTSNTDDLTINLAGLTIVKNATETYYTTAGNILHYSYLVTNVGSTDLVGPVTVADDKSSNETCPNLNTVGDLDADLDVGENITCTATYTVTEADVTAKAVTNTASASAGGVSSATDSETVPLAALTIVKSATETRFIQIGDTLHYSFLVTNNGGYPLVGPVTINDNKASDENCPSVNTAGNLDAIFDPGENLTCTATYSVTADDVTAKSVTNIATASAGGMSSPSDSVTVPLVGLSLVKNVTETTYSSPGTVLHYSFIVTNNAGAVLAGPVTVSDDKASDESCPALTTVGNFDANLDPGESITCTATFTVQQEDIDSGSVTNKATASADGISSNEATRTINATQDPLIQVVKTSTTTGITVASQSVPYRFTVTNTGNVTLTGVTVSDPKCTTALSGPTGDANSDNQLQTTETWIYTCSHLVEQSEIDAGTTLVNTVTADSTQSASDQDTLTIPIDRNPQLQVVKTSTTTEITTVGQTVPYRFTVTNTGNQTLSGITVSDIKCSGTISGPTGDANSDSKLQTDETWLFSCSHTVTGGEIDDGGNLANTVTADSTESPSDNDTLSIPITWNPLIQVVKSSTTTVINDAGDVIPYTFTVTNVGNQTLTGISISDPKCTTSISDPTGDTNTDDKLQVSETWVYTCNHTVTQAEINAGVTLANTVTVDSTESPADTDTLTLPIDQDPALILSKTATETVFSAVGDILHYTITAHNSGNVSLTAVSVSDPSVTGLSCSPAAPATLLPEESMICTGTHTIVQEDLDAGLYHNTASASATPPSGPELNPTKEVTVNAASKIGLAKELISTSQVDGSAGTWDVEFLFHIHNYEASPVTVLQVTEDLETAFPDPARIVSIRQLSSPTLHVNPGFDGVADQNLLDGTDILAPNGEAIISLVVRLIPAAGTYTNSAQVRALDQDGKTIGDVSQNGSDPDPDNNDIPGDNSTPTPVTFDANIFDPPHGIKVFDDAGLPILQWTMDWINDTNVVAVNATISDPISEGTTYRAVGVSNGYPVPIGAPGGSTNEGVSCTDSSPITTTELCYYEGPTGQYLYGRIVWRGVIGPDLGETDPEAADHGLKISFYVDVAEGITGVENEAAIDSDLNGDGDALDAGESRVTLVSEVWGTLPVTPDTDIIPEKSNLPDTGFASDEITTIPSQPQEFAYFSTKGITIEIPSVGLETNVLGVPRDGLTGEWDVTWLSSQVGWLEGTAYPTWPGNTILTAHVYLPSGNPGPFVDLEDLIWGDQIVIHSSGQRYVYEVREVKRVRPDDQRVFAHQEKPWLTLVTCQGYDEVTGEYTWRRIVRAVLISVMDE